MSNDLLHSFFCPTRVIEGDHAYLSLETLIQQFSCNHLFVVVDPVLAETPFFRSIESLLKENSVDAYIYSDVEPEPSVASVEAAFQASQAHHADLILAVGGGSTMDTAKAVGILTTNGGKITDYVGIEKFSLAPLPLIAIPTTAGTGSEVSGSCTLIDNERTTKLSIRHPVFNPARVAILDPDAVATLPVNVARDAGIDAFVHAFESFISKKANPFTDALNIEALRLISGNLRQFVANRANRSAARNMQIGATLAGLAFGQTGVGNVHCIARFIGGVFHLAHGLSNGLVLPQVSRFNLPAKPEKYARLAQAMGLSIQGVPLMEAARSATDAIEQLCRDVGIPRHMADLGVRAEELDSIAELCVNTNYHLWNPRSTSKQDFLRILEDAY